MRCSVRASARSRTPTTRARRRRAGAPCGPAPSPSAPSLGSALRPSATCAPRPRGAPPGCTSGSTRRSGCPRSPRVRSTPTAATAMAKPLDRELEAGLRRLKLRRVRELAPELLQTARTQRWPPEELLAVLVREEIQARERSNLANRLKAAGFPGHKTLDAFDPSASELPRATFEFLRSLEWLERNDNLVFAGPAGTGKSHLGESLGRAACQAGHRVRFFSADDLVEALYRGLADNTVGKLIAGLLRNELVIIDDLG